MNQEMRQILLEQGYSEATTNVDWARIYEKKVEGHMQVVLCVCEEEGVLETGDQLRLMEQRAGQVFQLERCFVLLLTDNPQRVKEKGIHLEQGWIWDERERRLIVYEDQPEDYYGLRRKLEEISGSNQANDRLGSKMDSPREAGRRKGFSGRRHKIAWVNLSLVVINVLIFLILETIGDTNQTEFMLEHGAMYPPLVKEYHEYYRFFTEMFVHFGINHLFNNMLVLYCLGEIVERQMGSLSYGILYLLSGLCGSITSYMMMTNAGVNAVSGGASGAIFGMMGALLAIVIKNRGKVEDVTLSRLILMIVLSLYLGFTTVGVDNSAHIGGMLGGFVLAFVMYREKRGSRR